MSDSRVASVALSKIIKNAKCIFFKKVSKMTLFNVLPQKDVRNKNSKTHFSKKVCMPAGALNFIRKSVLVFSMPAGAFVFLKKSS